MFWNLFQVGYLYFIYSHNILVCSFFLFLQTIKRSIISESIKRDFLPCISAYQDSHQEENGSAMAGEGTITVFNFYFHLMKTSFWVDSILLLSPWVSKNMQSIWVLSVIRHLRHPLLMLRRPKVSSQAMHVLCYILSTIWVHPCKLLHPLEAKSDDSQT